MPTTPRPATAGPMSRPTCPRIIRKAMATMKNLSVFAPSASRVPMRFLSSTALSSWAVPSLASRSRSAFTTPWTKIRARRKAMIAARTISRTGATSCVAKAAMSLHGLSPKSGIAGKGTRAGRGSGGRPAEPDRDRRSSLAGLDGQLGDAPRRQPECRAPDVDGGDHVAARVVDRRRDRVERHLVFADGGRIAAPPDPRQLLQQRLELDDGPLGVADEPTADDPQDLALGEGRQEHLPRRDAVERRRSTRPVPDRDEVRAVDLGDRQHRVAVEDPEARRLVGQPGEPLELGQCDAAQVERPFGPLGEPDDDKPESVLAGLVVLLDQTALLERGQEP